MNKKINTFLIMAVVVFMIIPVATAKSTKKEANSITAGEVFYSAGHYLEGEAIPTGYDIFGYNYQGHMFKGSYANVYLGAAGYPPYTGDDETYLAENPDVVNHWAWEYRDIQLIMKWNDAWISNLDQDMDGKLDRHYGFDSYIGSGAWETNHMFGEYEDEEGNIIKWNYFTKIVAAPEDAIIDGELWYTSDGAEIGPEIWGQFATIMEVSNDAGADEHGALYLSPFSAGFGAYAP